MAEGGPPECQTQKDEIRNCLNQQLKKGDIWYLLDTKWYKQWKKYVGYDKWDSGCVGEASANPGPIDNSPLLKGDGQLQEHLSEDLDYMLLPGDAWNRLLSWYGIIPGQEPICRGVIEQGMFVKHCKVEVYLLELKLCENSNLDKTTAKQFSRSSTIAQLEKKMREVFSIKEDKEVRLWNRYMSNTYEHLSKMENSLQDSGLYPGQVIVIEEKNDDGTWPRQAKSTSSYNTSSTSSYEKTSTRSYSNYEGGVSQGSTSSYNSGYSYEAGRGVATPGVCGLSNLGNTCFMNSALQCMSNVPMLSEYFLSNKWKEELNPENPLGMRGEIAESYAELIQTIWSGKYMYTLPRAFKLSVGRFAPQFSGYQQQDSQELMAFLLDGLHEDLNRIKSKPYVELTDANDRPDEVVAKEAWDNYRKRNDSVIIDTFHGLLKSTVKCPQCNKISVTFDPFCYLSLPLPIKKERQMSVTWVPLSPEEKPQVIRLTVPKSGCVGDLTKALSKMVDVPHKMIKITDVYNHRFHKVFKEEEGLNHILERDIIYAYEVCVKNTEDDPNIVVLPIYFRDKGRSRPSTNYGGRDQLFGTPLFIPVKGKVTYDMLYDLLLVQMKRYVKVPDPKEEWWKDEDKEEMETNEENGDTDKPVNGEVSNMDVCESDDELEDKKKDNGESKSCKARRLFTFSAVNSYGSAELDHKFIDDGSHLRITPKTYVAVDWHTVAKEKFYDEKEAESVEEHESGKNKNPQKKQVIQLKDCLQLFTEAEKLSEHDPWYCPSCKKHQQATKKFDLWSLPNILIIHLKRFSYNRYWRDKIDALVEFPVKDLMLDKCVINKKLGKQRYDLIAVSNHYGGLGGGHYTAYGLNKTTNDWYYFDDSSVSQSSDDQVVSKAAYVLVYQKRGVTSSQYISKPSNAPSTATSGASDCNMLNGAAAGTTNGVNSNGINHNDDMDTN
ncbi:ubiquitin carboxyl-terminal hydrolase 4 isoform X1 [Patella vulgata]|uniref:ubiquitin carboxyl-terminal hydrolase 4 isoform X1 n=1 Tax=Patella vulgata TaxID=6465 RepID=UPI00217F29C5|nr:ubiquitin carboxyl-terminal hydrolase 4 isoform X1 [Patella vulgata]